MKIYLISFLLVISACTSTTERGEVDVNRQQMMLIPNEQILEMSEKAYDQAKADAARKGQLDRNPEQVRRVQEIANQIIPVTSTFRHDAPSWNWEVHVISNPQINAYCMPGGKIAFYTGIIEKLQLSDGEIAAIMGHEIAHALREHGRERMSQQLVQNVALELLVRTGTLSPKYAGAANTAGTIMITLPMGRKEETEADTIGVELMARAGYNPNEAVTLWQKMAAQGGGKPPEILSTHPADSTRIRNIQALIPRVMPLYRPR